MFQLTSIFIFTSKKSNQANTLYIQLITLPYNTKKRDTIELPSHNMNGVPHQYSCSTTWLNLTPDITLLRLQLQHKHASTSYTILIMTPSCSRRFVVLINIHFKKPNSCTLWHLKIFRSTIQMSHNIHYSLTSCWSSHPTTLWLMIPIYNPQGYCKFHQAPNSSQIKT